MSEPYYERGNNANDELTVHAEGAGEWGQGAPSTAETDDVSASLPPQGYDYSAGMFNLVAADQADAIPGSLHPDVVAKLATAQPARTFETIHEATHRRYDSPFTVAISQSAAGFTKLVPPKPGLHFIKVLACLVTLDAAGTIKFVQGDEAGLTTADVSGAIPVSANSGFSLSPARIETPWFFTTPDLALGIFSVTGKASGFITCCYSPFDQ